MKRHLSLSKCEELILLILLYEVKNQPTDDAFSTTHLVLLKSTCRRYSSSVKLFATEENIRGMVLVGMLFKRRESVEIERVFHCN